jgi:hypothetical protein
MGGRNDGEMLFERVAFGHSVQFGTRRGRGGPVVSHD